MNAVENHSVVLSETNQVDEEISKFMAYRSDKTGLKFWQDNLSEFPNLSKAYKLLCSITPSNSSIERLFSRAKLILNDQRKSLQNIEAFMLCSE